MATTDTYSLVQTQSPGEDVKTEVYRSIIDDDESPPVTPQPSRPSSPMQVDELAVVKYDYVFAQEQLAKRVGLPDDVLSWSTSRIFEFVYEDFDDPEVYFLEVSEDHMGIDVYHRGNFVKKITNTDLFRTWVDNSVRNKRLRRTGCCNGDFQERNVVDAADVYNILALRALKKDPNAFGGKEPVFTRQVNGVWIVPPEDPSPDIVFKNILHHVRMPGLVFHHSLFSEPEVFPSVKEILGTSLCALPRDGIHELELYVGSVSFNDRVDKIIEVKPSPYTIIDDDY